MIAVDVEVEAEAWSALDEVEVLARRSAEAALRAAAAEAAGPLSATILLTDDGAVRELNHSWRGQDKPTNVLSFPASHPTAPGEPRHLGDVVLAYETVAGEARIEGKQLAHHAAHLIVHGILHLLGQDHASDAEADAMEAMERSALVSLGISDPYGEIRPGE